MTRDPVPEPCNHRFHAVSLPWLRTVTCPPIKLRRMKLSTEELRTFELACKDPGNRPAQELVNVFGVASAAEIVAQLQDVPNGLRDELLKQMREAIDEQKGRFRKP